VVVAVERLSIDPFMRAALNEGSAHPAVPIGGLLVGPSLYLRLAERHARMEGYTVLHYRARFPESAAQITEWLKSDKLVVREHVVEGIENLPQALLDLFEGRNIGKQKRPERVMLGRDQHTIALPAHLPL
jgi:hypothetical protein